MYGNLSDVNINLQTISGLDKLLMIQSILLTKLSNTFILNEILVKARFP